MQARTVINAALPAEGRDGAIGACPRFGPRAGSLPGGEMCEGCHWLALYGGKDMFGDTLPVIDFVSDSLG